MRKKEREVSDLKSLESIIGRCDVCRIALTDGITPYIVTMNFGYTGGTDMKIWFHCAGEGRKMDLIRKNNLVCFEMDTDHRLIENDRACDCSMLYSSVIGYGYIDIIDDPVKKTEGLNAIMSHYSKPKEFTYDPQTLSRTTVLCLNVTEITGKQLQK